MAKLLDAWEGETPPPLRRRDLFETPSGARRHDHPALEDRGTNPDQVKGHSLVSLENGFQRLHVELKFIGPESSFPVTIILPPGVSETLAIPTGQVRVERRIWNPAAAEPAFRVDQFPEQDLTDSRLFRLTLRSTEEERIARELELTRPSNLSNGL
jgi:hypothetical protein